MKNTVKKKAEGLLRFIEKSPTAFHAVREFSEMLKDAGFKYLEVSDIEKAVDVFYKVIDNQQYYLDLVKDNKRLATQQYSWTECIKDWVKVYKELCPKS